METNGKTPSEPSTSTASKQPSRQPASQPTEPASQTSSNAQTPSNVATQPKRNTTQSTGQERKYGPFRNSPKVPNHKSKNLQRYYQRSSKNSQQNDRKNSPHVAQSAPENSPQIAQPQSSSQVTPTTTRQQAQTTANTLQVAQPAPRNSLNTQPTSVQPDTEKSQPQAESTSSPQHAARVSSQVAESVSQPATRTKNDNQPPTTSKQKSKPPKEKSTKMVIVTGFPSYIQPLDLLNVFEEFSSLKITKLNPRFATIAFDTEEEAIAAAKFNNQLNLYGEVLTVKLYYGRPGEEPKHSPKREFARTKEKSVTIDPKKIDLSGDFHSQLDNILAAVRLTQEDVTNLSQLYTDVEYALQSIWPGCKTVPFGSITTGLGVKTSDADCFVEVPPQFRHPQANYVVKAKKILHHYPGTFSEILCIPRANTPIVKFFHIPTETNCDLTFKTPLGAQNSKLIAFLLHADPRLIPMAVVIKYWAKVHEFTGTGKLTNYTLTMMIIFYLQQPPISILPSVAWLQNDPANDFIVDSWNAGFMCQRNFLPPSANTSSISELLGGFFEYYSVFNFEEMIICPYLGTPIQKILFRDTNSLPAEFDRYKMNVMANIVMPLRYGSAICVQDPLEQTHNVASAITSRLAADIRVYFKHAAAAYEKEKLNRNLEFLKIILLQAPVLSKPKSHQEYRVNLFPRIIAAIMDPDWKSVVREIVIRIFEKLLMIKLGKVEETVKPDSRRQKEKYTGQVTKGIWKRKNFSKLYNATNLDFEAKQKKITEELLLVDKHIIDINFHLIITFCQNPASAVISLRIVTAGCVEQFREFGRFFISNMQHWFLELVKPYSKPLNVNVAETIKMIDKNAEEAASTDSDVENTPQNQSENVHANGNDLEVSPPVKETGNLNEECTTQ